MTKKERFTPEDIVDALRATKGMVYLTAQRLGVSPQTIYNYRDRYASVRTEMALQDGVIDDTAELKLAQAIMNGEAWAIAFRLRTKARHRGYVEKTEVEHSGGQSLQVFSHSAAITSLAARSINHIGTSGENESGSVGSEMG
mgnify:FL=1